MSSSTPSVELSSGHSMPLVGFGLWKVDNATCADQVYAAIKAGYRLLDGACAYGNEVEAGQGVARAIKDGLVKRSDLFITSKLWNSFHDREHVEPIARSQLKDWGIDYFDLYLIHFPISIAYVDPAVRYPPGWGFDSEDGHAKRGKASIQETWTAMEALVDAGLSKSIGVSNFQGSTLNDLLTYARIPPAVLQIEHHPYLVQPQLLDMAKRENIKITAYSSFGPQGFFELDWKRAMSAKSLFEVDVVTQTAKKVDKSPAQVVLRWATQRGIAVIPKSNKEQRLKENLDVTGWDLSQEDLDSITALDKGMRFNDPADLPETANLLIFA